MSVNLQSTGNQDVRSFPRGEPRSVEASTNPDNKGGTTLKNDLRKERRGNEAENEGEFCT